MKKMIVTFSSTQWQALASVLYKALNGNMLPYISSSLHWSQNHYSTHVSDGIMLGVPRETMNFGKLLSVLVLHTFETFYNIHLNLIQLYLQVSLRIWLNDLMQTTLHLNVLYLTICCWFVWILLSFSAFVFVLLVFRYDTEHNRYETTYLSVSVFHCGTYSVLFV